MSDLWFVRHGESVWNAEGRWQGQADPPLTERGRHQAQRAAERLARLGIACIVASDLGRARETAQILGARLGLAPSFDPALRELDVGRWSGHPVAEVARRWPEELAAFRAGDLALAAAAAPVAVVSHLGVLRALRPGAELAPGELVRFAALAELADEGHTPEAPTPAL
jgi:broad specificity phosphatase PhoE